jgi:hypothetical protein
MMRGLIILALANLTVAAACGSGADAVTDSPESGVDAALDSGADATPEDAGGRVADFNYGAICTASWLSHDVTKPIRFAIELSRGLLPNRSASVSIWFTPLRATAQIVASNQTVGSTLTMPAEGVGDDYFDAPNLKVPNDTWVLPPSAMPNGKLVELLQVGVFGYVPDSDKKQICVWIEGALEKPKNQPETMLRCLLYNSDVPLTNPKQQDFEFSTCAKGSGPTW